MADVADTTGRDLEQYELAQALQIRAAAAAIPKGVPGECNECGLHNDRLVYGKCSPCRDDLQRRRGLR